MKHGDQVEIKAPRHHVRDPREEGGTVFLIRIGHEDESEQKEPELVEMRPVLPLADRALA